MTGLCLRALAFIFALALVVWGLSQSGASDDAIVFGVIGLGLALFPWAMFWLMRRRRPDRLIVPPERRA